MNAKEEFLAETQGKKVKCAYIVLGDQYYLGKPRTCVLREHHKPKDMKVFLESLDFEYDDGYGCQQLFGEIWYKDGTWSERYEYDGSEHWDYKACPEIHWECREEN